MINSYSYGDGQGGLACCDSCGRKESDTAEQLNWTELNWWIHSRYKTQGAQPGALWWLQTLLTRPWVHVPQATVKCSLKKRISSPGPSHWEWVKSWVQFMGIRSLCGWCCLWKFPQESSQLRWYCVSPSMAAPATAQLAWSSPEYKAQACQ